MSDPKFQYATQNNFTGGIATEPELRRVTKAGEVTVAEAADVWAPNGVLKRRPGVVTQLSGDSDTRDSAEDTDIVGIAVFVSSTGDLTYASYAGAVGTSSVILEATASDQTGILYLPVKDGYGGLDLTTWTGLGTTGQAFWVPPGGSILTNPQHIDSISFGSLRVALGESSQQITSGSLWVGIAQDITANTDVVILPHGMGGYSGIDFLDPAGNDVTLLGSTFSLLPSQGVYLDLVADSSGHLSCGISSSLTDRDPETDGNVTPDPALYNALSAPVSWATVVEANRTYCAFSNQVYEYRPDLADGSQFREAQVNDDPVIVGPDAPYNPEILAQYNVFPKASQIIYFNGLLFFTDIKGSPNVVQWGGPAIDGAVDILPVLSYAILSDSRDNSKNVGFGVYNSNLYVFKQNSIWALIPAGQSEVDGSYLFTSRLVTSGAGCSAPGSIVSTPKGIIFYNSGGFYIFDGQKTKKLTDSIKQLFDAIVPGNAYQMQAAHWPQRHSYVVTCKMSHPWSSDVFEDLPAVFDGTLEYDYQNEAWWLWLSVSGKALYMDNLNNFITKSFIYESRVLDPNKEYDSDVLAKSTATPYIKTQRFGYGESLQKKYRELRANGEIDNLEIETSVEINDQLLAATDYAMTFIPVDYEEIAQTETIPDGDDYSPPWGRREVRVAVQNDGQWAQVRLNGSYGPFTIYNINLGYYVEGRNG